MAASVMIAGCSIGGSTSEPAAAGEVQPDSSTPGSATTPEPVQQVVIAIPTNGDRPAPASLDFSESDVASIPLPGSTPDRSAAAPTAVVQDRPSAGGDDDDETSPDSGDHDNKPSPAPQLGWPAPGADTPMPASMVAVRGGESVVLVETGSGRAASLFQTSLTVDPEDRVGPNSPVSVDVSGRGVVYVETCCADPTALITPIDIGDAASAGTTITGSGPAPSPSGDRLALVDPQGTIVVRDLQTGVSAEASLGQNLNPHSLSWSPDSSVVAVGASDEAGTAIVTIDASDLSMTATLRPASGAWTMPQVLAGGTIVANASDAQRSSLALIDPVTGTTLRTITVEVSGGIVDIDLDSTGHWLLIVDGSGRALAFDGATLTMLAGDGYTAATW